MRNFYVIYRGDGRKRIGIMESESPLSPKEMIEGAKKVTRHPIVEPPAWQRFFLNRELRGFNQTPSGEE